MKKNITLALDDGLLKQAKHLAVEREMAVSELVAQLIQAALDESGAKRRKERAVKLLRKGIKLGGRPLSRDEIYERNSNSK
jgi:Family of unknown function (DUF6364)